MSGAPVPSHVALEDVVARVRSLPDRLRSLRVETRGWSDDNLSRLASDRVRAVLARRVPSAGDAPVRRSELRVRSWIELDEDAWGHPRIGVWPRRWRQELEQTASTGEVSRVVSGRDGDGYWWDHGDGVMVTDARMMKTSLASWWVVGTSWVDAPAQRELLGTTDAVRGRRAARIRVTSERAGWAAGPFFSGDTHEITVDLETGMTLAVTSIVDGAPFHHEEVTELEVDAPIAPPLTAVPAGAEPRPPGQGFRSVEEVAAAAQLSLLAPTWLPPEFVFQTGGVFVRDAVPEATLVFSRNRREFISLYEWPDVRAHGEEIYEWERVERGSRVVLVSDRGDEVGQRIAHTTLDGTLAEIHAAVPAPDLLDVAFSLEVVRV